MKWFIAYMLLIGSTSVAFAQRELTRTYATQKVNKRLQQENAALTRQQSSLERFINDERKKLTFKKVTIPIVFHIIYTTGQEYPSEAQVTSQIEALNRDFSKRGYRIQHPADTLEGFAKKAEDMEIEFCLAKEGPTGKLEPAVRFVPSVSSKWTDDDAIKTQRLGAIAWDADRYLNVWVGSFDDAISGYAQLPGGPVETDGIVIDQRFLGTTGTARAPYNEGKTLTHLVGNYLGLHDLWGESPCEDDYVEDTPIHNAPNYGCPIYKHVSTCGDNPVEMTMNFMDNTNDECQYMFTLGQKIRMQSILSDNGPRAKLSAAGANCSNKDTQNTQVVTSRENEQPTDSTLLSPLAVHIYPNPASNEIRIRISTSQITDAKLTAFNAIGAEQWKQSCNLISGSQEFIIDCRNWASGLYFFNIETDRQSFSEKVVITRH